MGFKKINIVVILLLLSFCINTIKAQEIQGNLSQIEVDNLSDKEVTSYWNKIKEEGYTLEQALSLAKTRGMSELQAQKLQTRIRNLGNTSLSEEKSNDNEIEEKRKMIYILD